MSERYGPLKRASWPQNTLEVPQAGARYMPPVSLENREFARREYFAMVGSIVVPDPSAAGQEFQLFLATEQDGDFWCDQIYCTMFSGAPVTNGPPMPALLQISDARTGRRLCYPEGIAVEFLANDFAYQDKPVIDYSISPLPDGFRSTSTLPQPFCFTRQGGIQLTMTLLYTTAGATTRTVDFAFSGWKEYAHASA